MSNLDGRVALVTGASKGMGRVFVEAMASAGMNVAAVARESPELSSLAGSNVFPVAADVTDPRAIEAAITAAVDRFGRLDVLLANAAIYHPFAFECATDEDIRGHFDVNVMGVSWAIRAAIPHLRATEGQIVTISSESVRMPFPMLATYAASKAALETLCLGLREELRSDNIRMTVLRSGSVQGGSGAANWNPEISEAFFRKIVSTGHAAMSGESASPESMAKALLAVLSLPPDISVDLIEVRAAREGMPAKAKAIAGAPR